MSPRRLLPALTAAVALALPAGATAAGSSSSSSASAVRCDANHINLWNLQEWWRRTDTGKHVITRAEFTADAEITWTDFDVDGDGEWAGTEVEHARKQSTALLTRDASRPNYLCAKSDKPASGSPSGGGAPDFVKVQDTDGNGVVTRAEYDSGVTTRFDAIDTTGDDRITPREAYRYGRFETAAQQRLLKRLRQ